MTAFIDGVLDVQSSSQGHRSSRVRSELTWRWQRRAGTRMGFGFYPQGGRTADENSEALRSREHIDYLKRMAAEGVVPPALATKAKAVWWVAQVSAGSSLPVPAAAAFSGGPVEYHWSLGPHQLSAEIPSNGPCHWTYRNGATGELWGVETLADEGLPPRLIQALNRISASSH